MATLPEIAEWVSGVYQIEESDPVLGGPPNESTGAGLTNIPALHLAKRTAYLKQVLDDAGIGATAAPAIADFNAVGASGLYQAASAANAPEPGVPFTLMHIQSSATQATQIASRITSDRVWIRRLAAGNWSPWREILHTGNAASILGLGSTPPQFDNDTSVATTAFVQRALGNHADFIEVAANRTLTAADAGKVFFITANVTVTLPTSTALTPGVAFRFVLSGSSSVTFAGGSALIENDGGVHTGAVSGVEVTLHAVSTVDQYRMTTAGRRDQQIGVGQTWKDVAGSRAINTVYQNTSGKPKFVNISFSNSFQSLYVGPTNPPTLLIGNLGSDTASGQPPTSAIIPPGHYYQVKDGVLGTTDGILRSWTELD